MFSPALAREPGLRFAVSIDAPAVGIVFDDDSDTLLMG